MEITRGKINSAKKVLIYGPEGIGKTTFAAAFPDPLFIDTEGSTKEQDVARLPAPSSWTMIKEEVRYVCQNPAVCRTLVIDTADWAEKMAIQAVLDEHNKNGIEDFGYGNGYRYVYEKFGELLNLLNDVISCGIHVVMTAHATLKKFEQPDELGAYDRYSMKLIDSPKTSISAAVKEWSDMVLFANYKTIVVTDSKTKKSKAQGGKRIMYTTHHSCWDAKNRYGLPEELPFDYASIRSIIENRAESEKEVAPSSTAPVEQPRRAPEPEEPMPAKSTQKPETKKERPGKAHEDVRAEPPKEVPKTLGEPAELSEKDLDVRIPKALRDLMLHDNIGEWDIENFAATYGFVTTGSKIWEFEQQNSGIIDGLFVADWDRVRDAILQARKEQEIPFN